MATRPDSDAFVEAKGAFVAVGYGGRRVRSLDGVTWQDDQQLEPNGTDDDKLLRNVFYANKQFIALGYRSMTSPDGKTWSDNGLFAQWIGSALWDGSKYVAVGGYGLRATSNDTVLWTDHAIDTLDFHSLYGIAFGGGQYAAVNDTGVRETSPDGVTWSRADGDATETTDVVFGAGVFVSIGGAEVLRSTDGGRSYAHAATLAAPCEGIIYANGQFLALAEGQTFTSPDGATWTAHISANAHKGTIAFGRGVYVLLHDNERLRSEDGVQWTSTANDMGNALVAIAFGPI